jgi:hypothetical protein
VPLLFFFFFFFACREKPLEPAAAPSAMPSAASSSSRTAAPSTSSSKRTTSVDDADVLLSIPARAQASESPPSGWCGETAIQEALLYLGVWAPQRFINQAGHPSHPDLYSPDIPVALDELGVKTTVYPARGKGYEPFAKWIRTSIDDGDPVLAGVKILPTQHPDWGLDHFVLVVGYGKRGLLVNTTWGHREWVGDTTTPGLSFKNAFWAIRLRGVALPSNAVAARLVIASEEEREVKLRVECKVPTSGGSYRIERRSKMKEPKADWSEDVVAKDGRVEREVVAPADQPARFHCVPL